MLFPGMACRPQYISVLVQVLQASEPCVPLSERGARDPDSCRTSPDLRQSLEHSMNPQLQKVHTTQYDRSNFTGTRQLGPCYFMQGLH
jgi:hypothetical protein